MENEKKIGPPLQSVPRAAGDAPEGPPKKSKRPFAIVGVILGVLAIGIATWLISTAGEQSTDDAQVASDLVPIGARVAGQVKRVAVIENQLVKRGDLIAEIDDADYTARVAQAEAELATATAQAQAADAQVTVVEASSKGGFQSAQAMLSGSTSGVGSAQAQVLAARAAVMRAETDVKKADIDLQRAKELRVANAVPQERLDNAQVAYDSAQAALAQARANAALADEAKHVAEQRVDEMRGRLSQSSPIASQIATARANADLAHARIKSSDAQLQLARNQLGYTKIVSPADGLASKLTVHEGQLVGVGQPLVELVPIATYVIANFKETQIGSMKKGQKVDITVDAFPGRKLEGALESISGGTGSSFSLLPADNASGNFVKVVQRVPVRIAWVNPPTDVLLRAGLSADVTVHVEK